MPKPMPKPMLEIMPTPMPKPTDAAIKDYHKYMNPTTEDEIFLQGCYTGRLSLVEAMLAKKLPSELPDYCQRGYFAALEGGYPNTYFKDGFPTKPIIKLMVENGAKEIHVYRDGTSETGVIYCMEKTETTFDWVFATTNTGSGWYERPNYEHIHQWRLNVVLYYACMIGRYNFIDEAIKRGAQLEDPICGLGPEYATQVQPFDCMRGACMNGNMDLISYLISKGASNWSAGLEGACMTNNLELAKLMISKGAKYPRRMRPVADLNLVKFMFETGYDDKRTVFLDACFHGHADIVEYVLTLGDLPLYEGLETACEKGHLEVVKLVKKQSKMWEPSALEHMAEKTKDASVATFLRD